MSYGPVNRKTLADVNRVNCGVQDSDLQEPQDLGESNDAKVRDREPDDTAMSKYGRHYDELSDTERKEVDKILTAKNQKEVSQRFKEHF